MRGEVGRSSGRKQLAEKLSTLVGRLISPWGSADVEQSADHVPVVGYQPVSSLNRTAHTRKPPDQGQRDENGDDARDRERRVPAVVPSLPAVADVERPDQVAAAGIGRRPRPESLKRGEPEALPPVEHPQRADREATNGAVAVVDDRECPPEPITS
jgi:hypothetical protein